jgi:hypothetical protein
MMANDIVYSKLSCYFEYKVHLFLKKIHINTLINYVIYGEIWDCHQLSVHTRRLLKKMGFQITNVRSKRNISFLKLYELRFIYEIWKRESSGRQLCDTQPRNSENQFKNTKIMCLCENTSSIFLIFVDIKLTKRINCTANFLKWRESYG